LQGTHRVGNLKKRKKLKKKKTALFVNLENMVLDKWNQWLKNLGPADN